MDSLAKTGSAPEYPYKTSVASLFEFDPQSTEAIYGGDPEYRYGLDSGLRALKDILNKRQSVRAAEIIRYGLSMLHLSGKLQNNKRVLDVIGERLRAIKVQVEPFDPIDAAVVSSISKCYQDTLSTFKFRVHVQGDSRYLQNQEIADQVRALLLAGVRAAMLWRQMGGRRWHLLFYRGRILRTLNQLA